MAVVADNPHRPPRVVAPRLVDRLGLPHPAPRVEPCERVRLCYSLMHVAEGAGVRDLADGEYRPGDRTLEDGIVRQNELLLDEVGCTRPGFRLLEIGCGYGRLLRLARERGAIAVGVNLSPEQVGYCHEHGLQVYCCTYRDLLEAHGWRGRFDGVVANGSLEHWVQPEDVKAGRRDALYHESFAIAHRVIDPSTPDARYVTTALHVRDGLDPDKLTTPWRRFPPGSADRMFSLLHHWFGGYYPTPDLLPACARPYFTLERQTEGTTGYRLASEHRMRRMRRALLTKPKVLWGIVKALAGRPRETSQLLYAYFVEQAWDWQFRGDPPATTLLRQTWRRNAEVGV